MERGDEVAHSASTPELERALEELWRELLAARGGPLHPLRLRTLAAAVSSSARRAGFLPEGLIIHIKTGWIAHQELHRRASGEDARDALTEVVTACIAEYYRGDGAGRRGDGAVDQASAP